MAGFTATLLVASAIAAVAGAGATAYGQVQQGKTQSAIADFNAVQQEKQAAAQLLTMQTQAALTKQQAEANFKLRTAEADAHNTNADQIDTQALAQDSVNRLNLQKRGEEFARMQGEQRAAIAASGVAESSGTPLDLLAETAGKIQQDAEEQHYAGEVQRRTLFSEAGQERLGGRLALAGATLDRNSGVADAALRKSAADGEYLGNLRAAEITKLTGAAARSGSRYAAGATLFSGAASAAGTAMTYKRS